MSIHGTCIVPCPVDIIDAQLVYPMYKNEVYGAEWGASAMAISVAMRYLFSSPVPLFTIQLIDRVGFAWLISACALILTALTPVPFLLDTRGERLRSESRFPRAKPYNGADQGMYGGGNVASSSTSRV